MSVPSIPKDQFLAIKQLWQTKLALEEKVKSLEAICNINGNLKSILENLTKEFRAIPGSSISDTTGGSTVVDPATINHELLGGLLGGAANDHYHLTTAQIAALHDAVTVVDTASIDLNMNGQTLTAGVLPAGVDHNSLANLTTGDPHTQYTENSGSITQITTRNHSDLQNKNAETDVKHLTDAQVSALHAAVTIADSTSVDLSLTGQQISAAVLPAGVDHNSLANLTTGDPHTQYTENSGNITQITTRNHNDLQNHNAGADLQHMTAAQISALHAKQHSLQSTADHTSTATAGKILKGDANALPANSIMTELDNKIGINNATPQHALSIGRHADFDAAMIIFGNQTVTNKTTRILSNQYDGTGESEGFIIIGTSANSTANAMFIGGGQAGYNAATVIDLYTAADNVTRVGTLALRIDSALDALFKGNINLESGKVIKINNVDKSTDWTAAKTHADNTSTAVHGATTVGYGVFKSATAASAKTILEITKVESDINETLQLTNAAASAYFDITIPTIDGNNSATGKIVLHMYQSSGGDFTGSRHDRYDIIWAVSTVSPYITITSIKTSDSFQTAASGLAFTISGGKIRVTASATGGGTWSINVYVKGQIIEYANWY